jgi:hypothetical protein
MEILQELHDSEINASVESFYDGCWTVKLGDRLNGFDAEATVGSMSEAERWFRENAVRLYPDSAFARRAKGLPPRQPDGLEDLVLELTNGQTARK